MTLHIQWSVALCLVHSLGRSSLIRLVLSYQSLRMPKRSGRRSGPGPPPSKEPAQLPVALSIRRSTVARAHSLCPIAPASKHLGNSNKTLLAPEPAMGLVSIRGHLMVQETTWCRAACCVNVYGAFLELLSMHRFQNG